MKQKLCVIGEALIDFIPQRKGCDLKDQPMRLNMLWRD